MTTNYAIAFVVIALAVAAGQMLTQFCLLARGKRRRKRQQATPLPKPEPQAIEFNVVLSGADDVEAGLARIEAVIERIAEAAGGVPVTINNYYDQMTEEALADMTDDEIRDALQCQASLICDELERRGYVVSGDLEISQFVG